MLKLAVGQEVGIRGHVSCDAPGTVVRIEPPFIYVESNGLYRFNMDGKECLPDGRECTTTDTWGEGPYSIVE
jgi:hypothetical protein